MLRVPTLRQPSETACLPTCVEAVLRYHGHACDSDEVRHWCHTRLEGSDADLAVQGLNDAGIDAELLQCGTLDDLRRLIEEDRPPIVLLWEGGGWYHAVVVCEADEASVVVMDPIPGSYVTVSTIEFLLAWQPVHADTLLVGARPSAR